MEENYALVEALEKVDVSKVFVSAATGAIERFQGAVKKANPQLNEDQLEAYKDHFSANISALVGTMLMEYRTAMSDCLSEQESKVFCEFVRHPDIDVFLNVMRKSSSTSAVAIEKVLRECGVPLHHESFQAAIITL